MKFNRKNICKAIVYLLGALATAFGIATGMSSCTVVRNVTTTSEYHQRGDTSVIIQSKTIESYTGERKVN